MTSASDDPVAGSGGPNARGRRQLAGAALLLAAGGALGAGVTITLHDRSGPTYAATTPVDARVPAGQADRLPAGFAPPAATSAPVGHSAPVEVAIPAIGVRSELVGLRLNADGTLQVPTDFARAGWYRDGPAPGDAGPPAIIVGHVDSYTGPAVFFRLPALRTGDAILVRGADGTTVRFAVYRVADYAKKTFPAAQVYAKTGRPELRLITCTGDFDRATGHYLGNLVVYAAEQPAPAAHPTAAPSRRPARSRPAASRPAAPAPTAPAPTASRSAHPPVTHQPTGA